MNVTIAWAYGAPHEAPFIVGAYDEDTFADLGRAPAGYQQSMNAARDSSLAVREMTIDVPLHEVFAMFTPTVAEVLAAHGASMPTTEAGCTALESALPDDPFDGLT